MFVVVAVVIKNEAILRDFLNFELDTHFPLVFPMVLPWFSYVSPPKRMGDPGRPRATPGGRTTLWRGAREALAEEHAALASQRVEELYPELH